MIGTPYLRVLRSISLYGLSEVILTFDEGTDAYFARNVVFQRIADAQLPTGVTPSMAPLFSPSGLVYRYVLESPDRSPQELKTFEDWVVERAYRSVHGVADDSASLAEQQRQADGDEDVGELIGETDTIVSPSAAAAAAAAAWASQPGRWALWVQQRSHRTHE